MGTSGSVISGKIIHLASFQLFWWIFWKKTNFGKWVSVIPGKNSNHFSSLDFFFKEWRLLISRLLDFFFQDSRGLIDMGIILTRKKFSTSRTDNKARLRINFANQDSNYMVLYKISIKLTKPVLNKPDFGPWYAIEKTYLVKYSLFQPYSTQTIFRAYGSRVDAYFPSRPSRVVDQRLTHFNSVQNLRQSLVRQSLARHFFTRKWLVIHFYLIHWIFLSFFLILENASIFGASIFRQPRR